MSSLDRFLEAAARLLEDERAALRIAWVTNLLAGGTVLYLFWQLVRMGRSLGL
ncbi:MAG: hypothetical protein H5U02_00125 [Clostridia bacterium]|nr:hypothetical protein [Clostridia bacterium]